MNIKEQIQKRGFTIIQVAALITNKNGEKVITQSFSPKKIHLLTN